MNPLRTRVHAVQKAVYLGGHRYGPLDDHYGSPNPGVLQLWANASDPWSEFSLWETLSLLLLAAYYRLFNREGVPLRAADGRITADGTSFATASVRGIHPQQLVWENDATAHAVVVVLEDEALALFVGSSSRAESLARRLAGFCDEVTPTPVEEPPEAPQEDPLQWAQPADPELLDVRPVDTRVRAIQPVLHRRPHDNDPTTEHFGSPNRGFEAARTALGFAFSPYLLPLVLPAALMAACVGVVLAVLGRTGVRIRADRGELRLGKRVVPASKVRGVHADVIRWPDGEVEHATIVVLPDEALALYVQNQDRAVTLAGELAFLCRGASGARTDVPGELDALGAAVQPTSAEPE